MVMIGAFLGGPDYTIPVGKSGISLCVNTMDRQNLSTASFTITASGFNQTVQADASGRGYIEVDSGKTYTVALNIQGNYKNTGPQTVIAESRMNYGILFDLYAQEVVQTTDGISVDGQALQDATSIQDGLMTKSQASDLTDCNNKKIMGLDVDVDSDKNLIFKLTQGNGNVLQDSINLTGITGSLYVNDVLIDATIKITQTATQKVIYSGPMVVDSYGTGMGSVSVEISQYGKTVTKSIEVMGDTNLDLSDVTVTLTPSISSMPYKVNNGTQVTGPVRILKGSSLRVEWFFGANWPDGSAITGYDTVSFANDVTVDMSASRVYLIQSSGSFVVPKTATYEILLTGGGGGGGSGGRPNSESSYGSGGYGGNGGVVNAYRDQLTEGESIPVTIGAGGSGGRSNTSSVVGNSGSVGGETIFGEHTAGGGGGGSGGSSTSQDYGGYGGYGSNRTKMSIFGVSKAYGTRGNRGYSAGTASDGEPGSSGLKWPDVSEIGDGGDGEWSGRGGDGGYGFVVKSASRTVNCGRGGKGSSGASSPTGTSPKASSGASGGVAIRMVIV